MPYIYNSYTEYLYEQAMTLWYAGATYQPVSPALVDLSTVVYERSWKAAIYEGVMHPEDGVSITIAEQLSDDDLEEIPF